VAADGPWMLSVLESVLPHDDFTRRLVEIYQARDFKLLLCVRIQGPTGPVLQTQRPIHAPCSVASREGTNRRSPRLTTLYNLSLIHI